MATREGARAFGLPVGILAPGRLADIVLLRRDTPSFTPLNNVLSQLALCENGSSVDTVFVDGELVVEKGRLTRRHEKEVLGLVNKSMDHMRQGMQREMLEAQAAEPDLAEMYFRIVGQRKDRPS